VPLLPHEHAILQSYNNFSIHRARFVEQIWGDETLVDIREDPSIDTWAACDLLLPRLCRHFRFGETLSPEDYHNYLNTFPSLAQDAREQLFYWQTAGPLASRTQDRPVEGVTLFVKTEYLWFQHIAPIQQQLKDQILD
jgi:hypothetical protein